MLKVLQNQDKNYWYVLGQQIIYNGSRDHKDIPADLWNGTIDCVQRLQFLLNENSPELILNNYADELNGIDCNTHGSTSWWHHHP